MPKGEDFTEEQRKFALELYLDGLTPIKIARRTSSEFNVLISSAIVNKWIRSERWDLIKAEARNQAIAGIIERNKTSIIKTSEEHVKTYRNLWKKGEEALNREDKPIQFRTPKDATEAIDKGIQGERKVILGMINMKFVQDVLGILVEEVTDQLVLNRIAIKLKKLTIDMTEE